MKYSYPARFLKSRHKSDWIVGQCIPLPNGEWNIMPANLEYVYHGISNFGDKPTHRQIPLLKYQRAIHRHGDVEERVLAVDFYTATISQMWHLLDNLAYMEICVHVRHNRAYWQHPVTKRCYSWLLPFRSVQTTKPGDVISLGDPWRAHCNSHVWELIFIENALRGTYDDSYRSVLSWQVKENSTDIDASRRNLLYNSRRVE